MMIYVAACVAAFLFVYLILALDDRNGSEQG